MKQRQRYFLYVLMSFGTGAFLTWYAYGYLGNNAPQWLIDFNEPDPLFLFGSLTMLLPMVLVLALVWVDAWLSGGGIGRTRKAFRTLLFGKHRTKKEAPSKDSTRLSMVFR